MFVFGGISEEIGKEHLVLRYIRFISTKSYTIHLSKYSKTNAGSFFYMKKMSFQKRMVKKISWRYKIEHVGIRHVSGGRREIPLIGARENKSFILLPLKISPLLAIFRGKQPDMFLFKYQRNYSDISVFVRRVSPLL